MKTLKSILTFAVVTAALGLTGCASIISDSQYPVTVKSTPSKAHYEIRNEQGMLVHSGITPSNVTLRASDGYFDGESYTIKYMMPGHADLAVTLDSSIDGWYWGNLLIGGLIGMLVVDPLTGSMFTLPDVINGDLSQTAAGGGDDKNGLKIVSIDTLTAKQRTLLQRVN